MCHGSVMARPMAADLTSPATRGAQLSDAGDPAREVGVVGAGTERVTAKYSLVPMADALPGGDNH